MVMNIFFGLYSLLYILILPFILLFQILKRPTHLRKRWLKERFGFIGSTGGYDIWIHAVSVGEAMAARPLISSLRDDFSITVSTVTDTGQKVVKDFITEREGCFYLPFDIPSAINRAIDVIRPRLLIIMETEIWPNLIRVSRQRGITVVIVNGRISDRSFKGYRRMRFLLRPVLGLIECLLMQTRRDADRITEMGAPPERVRVTGNLKFDVRPSGGVPAWCSDIRRPVIVAGSTHDGEDEVLLDAFSRVKEEFALATLILAPRHPKRFPSVEGLISRSGFSFSRRSNDERLNGDVILLDTVGELSSVYGCADVCVVGGSFLKRGGQNLYEPAFWGKPIICGTHMENFPHAGTFFKEGAALMTEPGGLEREMIRVLKSRELQEGMGQKAKSLYLRNAGAVLKTTEVVRGYLS